MTVHHEQCLVQPVAAWIDQESVLVADVLRREDALRKGEYAARLPLRRSPQGRSVVRWIVQLIATERVIEAEADARGLAPREGDAGRVLDISHALELGGVLATVLSTMPLAEVVRDAVSAHLKVKPSTVRAYYDNNRDQFQHPESRLVEAAGPERSSTYRIHQGELPAGWEREVFAADLCATVVLSGNRRFTIRDIQTTHSEPFSVVRTRLSEQLLEHARDLFFADWMHRRLRSVVTLAAGYEHPGDPRHSDATHRH